jgi:hypothetical protein
VNRVCLVEREELGRLLTAHPVTNYDLNDALQLAER